MTVIRLCSVALWAPACLASSLLQVDFSDQGTYLVRLNGQIWLESSPLRAFLEGAWHVPSSDNTSGLVRTAARHYTSSDELGDFTCVNVSWLVAGTSLTLHTSLSAYADGLTAVFTQEMPQGAVQTDASHPVLPSGASAEAGVYPPVVAFPAFGAKAGQLPELGFVTWSGCMAPVESGTDVSKNGLHGLSGNGPVVLFDGNYTSLVVSPMDNFKNAVHTRSQRSDTDAWETGVSSEVLSLPRGFKHRTILKAGTSIIRTMDSWGTALRSVYGTKRVDNTDLVVNYLSYWTDNGAFYYGDAWQQAGGGGEVCNETAMKKVAEGLDSQGLLNAVRIWQLDDWWYPGPQTLFVHCVANWTLGHPAFQHSLGELSRMLGKPWLLYVPFFCPGNAYSQDYRFVTSVSGPVQFAEPHPDDALAFYRMLFDYGVANGMRGFENDFLNFNFLSIPHFRQQLGSSEKWLAGIDQAATERALPVQMCMAMPSDLLASLQLNSVTNFRASTDYQWDANLDIGGSAMLGYALDLRPSKDNFWTHRPTGTSGYKPKDNPGSNCELNALVATLSTGPVGLGDKAGDTNATLVLRSVRPDGLVIQPSRPMIYIDAMFSQPSLQHRRGRPEGKVSGTHAEIQRGETGEPTTWYYFISVDVVQPWKLSEVDFYPLAKAATGWVARRWHSGQVPTPCVHGSLARASGCVSSGAIHGDSDMPHILNDRPVMVARDTHRFDLMQFSPLEANGWVLLGDVSRYVSASAKRFQRVEATASGLRLVVLGAPSEQVNITALMPRATQGVQDEWVVVVRLVQFHRSMQVTVEFEREEILFT